VSPHAIIFAVKTAQNINWAWEINYENFALFLKTHAGGDDKL